MSICSRCSLVIGDNDFWDNHQTMQDGTIWCVQGRTKTVDEMTKIIVNKYKAEVRSKYGNKKRHRQ